ncbi:MAG: ABC transporter substrate-binding protein [Gammaproteobacteria bacterium]
MRHILTYSVILFIFSSIISCEKTPAPTPLSGLKIKIGIITSNTGKNASIGKQGLKGIILAQKLNSTLENGDEVELFIEDDQSNPVAAIKALKKLVTKLNVSAVLLLSDSNSAIAIAKIANKYKTPIIATIATNPETTQHSDYISQLAFNDSTQATVAALYIRDELFIKRVAVFNNPDNQYSRYLANEFAQKLKSIGGKVTDFINLSTQNPNDFPKILKQIQRNEPVLLYLPVTTSDVLAIAKAASNLDWTPKMIGTDGMLSRVYVAHIKDLDLVNGMLATDLYSSDMERSAYGKKIFNLANKTNTDINSHLLTGVEGYGLLLNAINQCEAPISRKCINNAIRTGETFTGITGKININKSGTAERTLFINKIEGEELKMVVKVN